MAYTTFVDVDGDNSVMDLTGEGKDDDGDDSPTTSGGGSGSGSGGGSGGGLCAADWETLEHMLEAGMTVHTHRLVDAMNAPTVGYYAVLKVSIVPLRCPHLCINKRK